jgi:hypothetical protein
MQRAPAQEMIAACYHRRRRPAPTRKPDPKTFSRALLPGQGARLNDHATRDTGRDDTGELDTYNHTCQLQEPAMSKKLTILIEDSVYEGLHRVVGRGSISKFLVDLARPYVTEKDLGTQYREAARDAAREREARAWTESLFGSVDETR